MTSTIRAWLAPTAVIFAAVFSVARLSDLREARVRLSALRSNASTDVRKPDMAVHVPVPDAEGAVTRAARDAHLKRLTNISTTGDLLSLEWESDLASSVAFLGMLNQRGLAARIPRLSVTSAEAGTGLVQVRVGIQQGPPAIGPAAYRPISKDPFRSLWWEEPSFARIAAENIRRQEADRRQQDERAEKERRDQEAVRQRDARRQTLQNRYALTGIVANGGGPRAFLTADHQRSFMVRVGDHMENTTVTAINEKTGEVTLDGGDAISVVFRLGGSGGTP